jgi:tetratricopeptide (TPR) repeat protein
MLARAERGSYVRTSRPLAFDVTRVNVLSLLGEYRRALELAGATIPRMEALVPPDAWATRMRKELLRSMYASVAWSAYQLGDDAASERAAARALEIHRTQPMLRIREKREFATEQVAHAIALARLGRQDEARAAASEALAFQRSIAPRNRDDAAQRLELAQALYAAAISGLGDGPAQLAEAAAIVQKLPPEMLKLRDVAAWQQRIAGERSRRRAT